MRKRRYYRLFKQLASNAGYVTLQNKYNKVDVLRLLKFTKDIDLNGLIYREDKVYLNSLILLAERKCKYSGLDKDIVEVQILKC